jgi:hypothetical protein
MSQDGLDMDAKGKDLASKCWEEDEEFLMKEKIAEWLGGQYVFCFLSSLFLFSVCGGSLCV